MNRTPSIVRQTILQEPLGADRPPVDRSLSHPNLMYNAVYARADAYQRSQAGLAAGTRCFRGRHPRGVATEAVPPAEIGGPHRAYRLVPTRP